MTTLIMLLHITGSFPELTITSNGGNSADLLGIVNGQLLVDSGAQWNTSQVWSDSGSGEMLDSDYDWRKAFDGNSVHSPSQRR